MVGAGSESESFFLTGAGGSEDEGAGHDPSVAQSLHSPPPPPPPPPPVPKAAASQAITAKAEKPGHTKARIVSIFQSADALGKKGISADNMFELASSLASKSGMPQLSKQETAVLFAMLDSGDNKVCCTRVGSLGISNASNLWSLTSLISPH